MTAQSENQTENQTLNPPQRDTDEASSVLLWCGIALIAGIYSVHVWHYWFVGDDAFISFRYAQNLVNGMGLVWNPSEYVEGYTNFLWVLMMAFGMWIGVEPEGLSCVLGLLSGAGILVLLGRFSAGRRGWTHLAVWLPLLALGLSRTFSAWSTGGLETQFFALLVVAGQLRFVIETGDASRWAYASSFLFALATLTRPEGGLFTAVAGFAFLIEVIRGRRTFTGLIRWTLPWLAIVGCHFAWRYAYYGSWLPNTFHAKVNGLWFEQALHYFGAFQDDYKLLFFLPLAVLAVARLRTFSHGYLAAGILTHCLYVLAIGGDRFEFRFLVVILPTLYWLIAEGLATLASLAKESDAGVTPLRAGCVAIGLALLATTFHGSIREEAAHMRHGIEWIEGTRGYAERRVREGRILAGYVEAGVLPADLAFSTGGAGALPYYVGWPTLDSFGLNDPLVARTTIKARGIIAHEHQASQRYLQQRKIVVFDSLNNLVLHDDPMQYAGKAIKTGGEFWKLHAVRLGEHTMVFSTAVPEAEFRRAFEGLEILY